ncbi:tRNA (guanosine(46)-N7)-methyltransferase TrmB [Hyphomonas sediminis]|uniref:tRNA (guanosine(46)-N7)-methyltransferase TrmB n=1 Tax=Hyphomonas sediminis TaxID=2866160 RepID=UPI001CEDF4D7|nr:tRNA (guanosine(46)-N7)-methyltransferase TrmB [Hyphomonas sediminis]
MTDPTEAEFRDRPLRSFGRTGGRPLSPRQKALMAEKLHAYRIPAGDAPLNLEALIPGKRAYWLEIGFGGAEHMVEQARRNPDVGIFGCEPFLEGVAKALGGIEDTGADNIRLWPDDARPLIERLPDASLERVFILFPDPWPKRRQHKRRLIQPAFLKMLHPKIKPGGRLRFATDVISYADEALHTLTAADGFEWLASSADDWRKPPQDHITTRYESKQLGDCKPVWFDFQIA